MRNPNILRKIYTKYLDSRFSESHMYPCTVAFVDEFRVRKPAENFHQLCISVGACGQVGGTPLEMIGAPGTAHTAVEFRAAVAAVHVNGSVQLLSCRVEYGVDEPFHIVDSRLWRRVVDALACGRGRAGQFGDGKVGHKVYGFYGLLFTVYGLLVRVYSLQITVLGLLKWGHDFYLRRKL